MRAAILCLALVTVATAVPAQSLDDFEDGLARQIADLERDTAGLDDADAGDIQTAQRQLEQLVRHIGGLTAQRRSLDALDSLLRDYESDADRVEQALEHLGTVVDSADQIEPMVAECEEFQRDFTRDLQRVIERGDTDKSDVDAAALDVSGRAEVNLDQAQEIIADLADARRALDRTLPRSDPFARISDDLSGAADAIWSREMDQAERLLEECEPLVDYEDHPGYEVAVAFFDDRAGAIERFLDDGTAWMDLHSDLGRRMCTFGQTIREAYCAHDPGAPDADATLQAYVNEVVRGSGQFVGMVDDALALYERDLAHVGAALAPFDRDAERLYDRIRARAAYYYRIQNARELRYMSDVAERLWIVYGQQQHQRIQANSFCNVVERYIPGASPRMRVDCVDIARCTVWEVKSDSSISQGNGQRQADAYAAALNDWMADAADGEDIGPASGSPGRGMAFDTRFLEHAAANFCLVEGRGFFEGQVLTYPRCRNDLELLCEDQPD